MNRIALLLTLLSLASPASAQNSAFCQQLWLSRNTVMDRAGHCFSTPLGIAVFDNSDCVEGGIRLNPLDSEIVRMAQETEVWANCNVDTDTRRLGDGAGRFHARLAELFTVPVRADSEHGCVGYRGAPIALYAGISTSMTVLGTAAAGQSLSLSHQPLRGGWDYVEVTDTEGNAVAHGWAQGLPDDMAAVCDFAAG